jgi:hypothetical protein
VVQGGDDQATVANTSTAVVATSAHVANAKRAVAARSDAMRCSTSHTSKNCAGAHTVLWSPIVCSTRKTLAAGQGPAFAALAVDGGLVAGAVEGLTEVNSSSHTPENRLFGELVFHSAVALQVGGKSLMCPLGWSAAPVDLPPQSPMVTICGCVVTAG